VVTIIITCWSFLPNPIDGCFRSKFGLPNGVVLGDWEVSGRYLSEVEDQLLSNANDYVRWPEPAMIDHQGRVYKEKFGRILDLSKTLNVLKEAKEGEQVDLAFTMITPSITSEEIINLTRLIEIYYTFIDGSQDRFHNIKLAAGMVDYTLVMPEEQFSFNQIIGEPTQEKGFREAPIIVKEEFVPGFGGGICQLSSTLYNVVLNTGLKIVERHTHSMQVNYVPPGRDATVAFDYKDFKFINSAEYPILIRVTIEGKLLGVSIYGPEI
ncbi:MAG: VanW family protein, partial [Desulfovibrionales bacterium]|nr:VanW family protein [Desulfovibrionales bacterium]